MNKTPLRIANYTKTGYSSYKKWTDTGRNAVRPVPSSTEQNVYGYHNNYATEAGKKAKRIYTVANSNKVNKIKVFYG